MAWLAPYPTEAEDGTPHLTYYVEPFSFVWSGNAEHPIQVCHGGYGEPVTTVIDPVDEPALDRWAGMSPMAAITAFKTACDHWLEQAGSPTSLDDMRPFPGLREIHRIDPPLIGGAVSIPAAIPRGTGA